MALVLSAGERRSRARKSLSLVEAHRLDQAQRHQLGRRARRAGGDALALEVLHGLDAGGLGGHHLHAVGVEHGDGARRHRPAAEALDAAHRVNRRVHLGDGHAHPVGAEELHVGDRAAGDLDRGAHAGNAPAEHVRHGAAERVVDAAGGAGSDGELLAALRARRSRARRGWRRPWRGRRGGWGRTWKRRPPEVFSFRLAPHS